MSQDEKIAYLQDKLAGLKDQLTAPLQSYGRSAFALTA
jgi:hypothetical protein